MSFYVSLFCAYMAGASAGDIFMWPEQYTTNGLINLPYASIEEPFTAVVDMHNRRSMLDTYKAKYVEENMLMNILVQLDLVPSTVDLSMSVGTAKVYNMGELGTYGTMYKMVPVTTKEFSNRKVCFKIPGSDGARVVPQGILPDMSNFQYAGDYTYNRMLTSVYISSFNQGRKYHNYTLLMSKATQYPVLFSFLGFDYLLDSHYDQYIIKYQEFTPEVDSTLFDVDFSSCTGFPGQDVTLPMAENHAFAFIGALGYDAMDCSHKVDAEFDHFKEKYGRVYDDREMEEKKFHFRHNHRYIDSINRQNLSYKLKVNHMADLSQAERKMMRGYKTSSDSPLGELYLSKTNAADVPGYFNWRLRGAVTPVKDQGICGSCWSFGIIGTIEGSYFLKHGMLVRMSEQALIDCSWGYGNNGCDGGESRRAYQWIIDNGCVPTELSYNGGQYLMQDGYCQVKESKCGATLSKFYNIPSGNMSALVTSIYEKGPISVAIDASHRSFSFYSHGVYYEPECGNAVDDLDHLVLVVGYGTLDTKPGNEFFMIKNSWSTHWGMDGYILMSRKNNNCGIATDASYADIV